MRDAGSMLSELGVENVGKITVVRASVMGSPNIGVFSKATDGYVLLPEGIPKRRIEKVSRLFKVKVLTVDLCDSKLLGVLPAANSHGILLPYYAGEEEEKLLRRELGVETGTIKSRYTSLGNLILANDKGAIVSPLLGKRALRKVEDVLNVEAVHGSIAGLPLPGSTVAATNKGALLHPEASDKDMDLVSDVLKVRVGVGTVNGGVSLVASGLIGNSHAVMVGSLTTGPELMTISTIFR